MPDVVGNLRVDQTWGSAQIGGALHQVNVSYYNTTAGTTIGLFGNQEASGNPNDEWGWAAMAGIRLNAPFIGNGRLVCGSGHLHRRCTALHLPKPEQQLVVDSNSAGYGITADGVYGGSVANGTATSVNLTTAWGVNAGYEHFWLPQWRTPLYGGYTNVKYNGQANAILCSLQGSGTGVGNLAVANVGCDNNWQSWRIGTRTQWNVTKDFYMGLDVAYLKIDSMSTSSGLIAGVGAIPATTNQFVRGVNDQDIWMARFRVHRDFYP